MTHVIRFFRHTMTGESVAMCTCGRSMTARDLKDVQTWADCHALAQLPEIPEIVPFASGLEGPWRSA